MRLKKDFLVFLLIISSTALSGCWSYAEIEDRLIVGTVGIDLGKSEGT
jgi:hypothetical protein